MSAPKLEAKCPACGGVRDVKPSGDGYVMLRHDRRSGYAQLRCDGGAVPAAEVLGWAKAKRGDALRYVDGFDARRKQAHATLAAELARIDAEETAARTDLAALDRAIAKIAAKVRP